MTEARSPTIWNRLSQHLIEWNVFTTEAEQSTLDNLHCNQTTTNPDPRILKEQRIATRVYIICLTISLLILVTYTLLIWQTKIVTIYNPTLEIYEKLLKINSTTLNCPCTTSIMRYKNFIIPEIAMHQICSSDFVSQEWISAFYISDSSRYGAMDFRTTAHSQFELLKTLCTLSRDNIYDAVFNLNNTQLLTASVLPKSTIFIRTKISSGHIRKDTIVRLNNVLKLLLVSTHNNRISSALNTNYVLGVYLHSDSRGYFWGSSPTAWNSTVDNQIIICRCDQSTCSFPAGFYPFADIDDVYRHTILSFQNYNDTDLVPGFVGSCTSLEAVLQATFVCLYEIECIKKLVPYFPRLAQLISTINTLNASISSKYPLDVNVSRLFEELFLEQWNISIDYNQYYTQCAPKICTYSYTKQADFIYMLTLSISAFGGLQTILRIFIPLIIKYLLKKRCNTTSNNDTAIPADQRSMRKKITERLLVLFRKIKNFLINLNLFESSNRSPEVIYHQRLSTKFYLCLLFGSLFILLLFTTISEQTMTIIHSSPSYITYKNLYMNHSDKLICPCTEITANYTLFINITPIYHPICSSAFVNKIWIDQLRITKGGAMNMLDWRISSQGYFGSLAALCKFASDTVNNDLQEFGTRTIVTTQLLNEVLLHSEINNILEEFIHSMQTEFERVSNMLRLLFQVNQYYTGASYNGFLRASNQTVDGHIEAYFFFHGPTYVNDNPKCLCAFDPNCEELMFITHNNSYIVVPGFVTRCSAMDSILQSTLECLYSNTNCLTDILLRYINYTGIAVPVPPLNISQLIRTSSNSKVVTLANNLFIEEWKSTISHMNYFQTCAPSTCQYTYAQRANSLYIVTVFLAVYGGLIFSLRLLVPLAVKFALRCRCRSVSTDNQHVDQVSRIARVRAVCQDLFKKMRKNITELNLFRTYSFGKYVNQNTRIRLGRLTTRLYICLYAIALIILALYTLIGQRILTEKNSNPSLSVAQQLQDKYMDTIECPCTRASIPIDEFVHIQPHFHQICTSIFVTNEWREGLTTNIDNMSYFVRIEDYRPYLSAHLQFLSGLCQHAIKHVNETIRSFTSKSFVTSRLLSQSSFDMQISDLLNKTEANVLTGFTRELYLAQAINHENKLITVYESNYKLVVHKNRTSAVTLVYTQPMTYYKSTNCSCGLQSNCVTQAAFTWPDYVIVKGFLIGCFPSQSLLASTLECFFDIDCINLIRKYMPGDINRTDAYPLNVTDTTQSRYNINTTVNELVSKLFIEEWSTKIFYDRYFVQCAPNICTYSYIDNANPLYVATTLLGLYGGLTVVLSWWCPRLVKFVRRLRIYYKKKRRVRVAPRIL